jgi:Phospholipase_D-nuclease N-terminal
MASIDFGPLTMALFLVGPWLYAVVDAFSRPELHWVRADHNKALWVLALVFLPFVAAPGYLIVVRPRLRHAQLAQQQSVLASR